jgi:hypothetical protein
MTPSIGSFLSALLLLTQALGNLIVKDLEKEGTKLRTPFEPVDTLHQGDKDRLRQVAALIVRKTHASTRPEQLR